MMHLSNIHTSHLSRAIGEFDHSVCVLPCLVISSQQPEKHASMVKTLGRCTFTILFDLRIKFLNDLSVCEYKQWKWTTPVSSTSRKPQLCFNKMIIVYFITWVCLFFLSIDKRHQCAERHISIISYCVELYCCLLSLTCCQFDIDALP